MSRILSAAFCAGLVACGSPQSGEKTASSFAVSLPVNHRIEVPARATTLVVLAVLGSDGPVRFSLGGAPTFATLEGDVLTLSPTVNDLGSSDVLVTATDGTHSDSKTLTIAVIGPKNRAPVFNGIDFIFDSVSSEVGSGWTGCYGTPWILLYAHDDDGDAMRLEAEVVPDGVPFSVSATHVSALQSSYQGNASLKLDLNGLVLGQPYRVAYRVVDEWGGASIWVHPWQNKGGPLVCTPFAMKVPGMTTFVGAVVTSKVEVVGAPPFPVTVTAENLPPYATFDGVTLTVAPTESDRGKWADIAFVASGGGYLARQATYISIGI
jgi:hypothetical protein